MLHEFLCEEQGTGGLRIPVDDRGKHNVVLSTDPSHRGIRQNLSRVLLRLCFPVGGQRGNFLRRKRMQHPLRVGPGGVRHRSFAVRDWLGNRRAKKRGFRNKKQRCVFLRGFGANQSDRAKETENGRRQDRGIEFFAKDAYSARVITFLEGLLSEVLPTQVVVDVHGVGYQVLIPLSSFDKLPPEGQKVRILTHLAVREDAHILYGFVSREERDLFRLLIHHVSGVGPKLALSILSGMSVAMFKAAVVAGDIAAISRISGLGKKTAERIVVELKDKVGVAAEWEAASAANQPGPGSVASHDAVLALISLGYKQVDALRAVKKVLDTGEGEVASEELVRGALKLLV